MAAEAQYDPAHSHEPEIPPVLDGEGRCLVCVLLVEHDEARALAETTKRRLLDERATVASLTGAIGAHYRAKYPARAGGSTSKSGGSGGAVEPWYTNDRKLYEAAGIL